MLILYRWTVGQDWIQHVGYRDCDMLDLKKNVTEIITGRLLGSLRNSEGAGFFFFSFIES